MSTTITLSFPYEVTYTNWSTEDLELIKTATELEDFEYRTRIAKFTGVGRNNKRTQLGFFKDGQYHREDDKPALIYSMGSKKWYKNGKLHRENDLPAHVSNKLQEWLQMGEYHRTNGPAVVCKNYEAWYQNGKLHRLDGPAIISDDTTEYYVQDHKLTEQQFNWLKANNFLEVWNQLSVL